MSAEMPTWNFVLKEIGNEHKVWYEMLPTEEIEEEISNPLDVIIGNPPYDVSQEEEPIPNAVDDIAGMDDWEISNKLRTIAQEKAAGNFDENTLHLQLALMVELNRRQGEQIQALLAEQKGKSKK